MKPSRFEPFDIASVCRKDLESQGFDTENVDDDIMRELAKEMAYAYLDNSFWADLNVIAEDLKIPRKGDYKDNK
jgi:hypothetical protein